MTESAGGDSIGGKIYLSFDLDFPEDYEATPALLDALFAANIVASFAVVGTWVERYPETIRRIVREGHELVNHTEHHPWSEAGAGIPDRPEYDKRRFNDLDLGASRAEIHDLHHRIRELVDYEMVTFRAPHFGCVDMGRFYSLLDDLGYRIDSSVLAPAGKGWRPYQVDGVLEVPISHCPRCPGSPFDTWHSLHWKKHAGSAFLDVWRGILDEISVAGSTFNAYFDPLWLDGRAGVGVLEFIEACQREEVDFVLYRSLLEDR